MSPLYFLTQQQINLHWPCPRLVFLLRKYTNNYIYDYFVVMRICGTYLETYKIIDFCFFIFHFYFHASTPRLIIGMCVN